MSIKLRRAAFILVATIFTILYIIFSKRTGNILPRRRLAVIVPFRDRFDELITFIPLMHEFLKSQNLDFRIYIINQSRKYRFNRASLINVGFTIVKNESDYIAIHDVDLIPLNHNISYAYPERGPYHVASPKYHPQYNYEKYFGGILLIKNQHFEMVNGMSNRYFGWGLEDDEFYTRIKAAKLSIFRPSGLLTDKRNTFMHLHFDRMRDKYKTKHQREKLRRRDTETGLTDLKYGLNSRHELSVDKDEYKCTIINVELYCDIQLTPWCVSNRTQSINQD